MVLANTIEMNIILIIISLANTGFRSSLIKNMYLGKSPNIFIFIKPMMLLLMFKYNKATALFV